MFKVYTKNSIYRITVHPKQGNTFVINKMNDNRYTSEQFYVSRFHVQVGQPWSFLWIQTGPVMKIEREACHGNQLLHAISGDWNEGSYFINTWGPQENDRKNRQEVYQAIDEEREYQDSVWSHSGPNSDGKMTVGESILCLEEYVKRARNAWTDNANMTESLHMVRKCAAIAVHCMEVHGAPKRNMTDYPSRKS